MALLSVSMSGRVCQFCEIDRCLAFDFSPVLSHSSAGWYSRGSHLELILFEFGLTFVCLSAHVQASFGTFCVMSLQQHVPRFCRTVPERHIRRRQYKSQEESDSNPWIKPRVPKPVTDDEENGAGNVEDGEAPSTTEQENKKQKLDTAATEPKPIHGSRNCSICLQYNGMLYLNFVGPNEMVVVEQPWLEVVGTLPEAIQRRVYGLN